MRLRAFVNRPGIGPGRLMLLVLAVALIVGALTWFFQFQRGSVAVSGPGGASKSLVFNHTFAIWDAGDAEDLNQGITGYSMEYESGEHGHYDFPFDNSTAGTVRVTLVGTSLAGARAQAAILLPDQWKQWQKARRLRPADRPDDSFSNSFDWHEILQGDVFEVPGRAKGLVRLSWIAPDAPSQQIHLTATLAAQPEGAGSRPQSITLEARLAVVPPLRFATSKILVGVLRPGAEITMTFACWSATRPKLDLQVKSHSPLIFWEAVPLTTQECSELEALLRRTQARKAAPKLPPRTPLEVEQNSIVRCGYNLTVRLVDQKDGKLFDQGPLRDPLLVRVDGRPLTYGVPPLLGLVLGDVEVGGQNGQGEIDLGSFKTRAGTRRTISLWAERTLGLKLEGKFPSYLQVTLGENRNESTLYKKNWEVRVEVPAGNAAGPLPPDSAIILRTQSDQSRRIRIPLVGTGVRG